MEFLSWLVIALFAATWARHTFAVAGRANASDQVGQPFRRQVDAWFRVLMSVAMLLAMLWRGLAPEAGSAVTLAQIAVFGGGALWCLLTCATVHPCWFDATAMAAMVWMLMVMQLAGTGGGSGTTPAGATGRPPDVGDAGDAGSLGHPAETVAGPSWTGVVTLVLIGLLVHGVAHALRRWGSRRPAAPDSLPDSPHDSGPDSGAEGVVGAVIAGMAVSLLVMS